MYRMPKRTISVQLRTSSVRPMQTSHFFFFFFLRAFHAHSSLCITGRLCIQDPSVDTLISPSLVQRQFPAICMRFLCNIVCNTRSPQRKTYVELGRLARRRNRTIALGKVCIKYDIWNCVSLYCFDRKGIV